MPSNFFRSSWPPYPSNIMVFLFSFPFLLSFLPPFLPSSFLKNKQANKQSIKIKTDKLEKKRQNNTKTIQKVHRNHEYLVGINYKQSLLVRDGTSCPLPFLRSGVLSGLSLCRPCAWCHGLYEFISTSVLLHVEDDVSRDRLCKTVKCVDC